MKRFISSGVVLGLALLTLDSPSVGGPRGGGGARGGGVSRGGAVHSYGGAGVAQRSSGTVVGPSGGSASAGRASGTATTRGGTTVQYAGAGAGRTTPGGAQAGRAVGGVQVTTPAGREVTKTGHAGGVSGPGGRAVGGKESTTVASGSRGTAVAKSQGGAAIGPQGGAATKSRAAVSSGGGVASSRSTVASGGYGVAAGRTTTVARQGTYYRSSTAIRSQGGYVRHSVSTYPCFRASWYRQYPGAWFAAGWTASAVWRAATWDSCASYCGITSEPVYYDYGSNVGYQSDGVYLDGDKVASEEEYAAAATELADAGRDAKVKKDEEWLPLGVFAMAQGEEKTSNHIFQLSVNKKGIIRGNYYDAVTDTNSEVTGSVDRKTQRAAWTVGDRKTPVYEAGIANLTKESTTMVVHYSKDRSAQFVLVRLEESEEKETEKE